MSDFWSAILLDARQCRKRFLICRGGVEILRGAEWVLGGGPGCSDPCCSDPGYHNEPGRGYDEKTLNGAGAHRLRYLVKSTATRLGPCAVTTTLCRRSPSSG